jgi:hypothetical protein
MHRIFITIWVSVCIYAPLPCYRASVSSGFRLVYCYIIHASVALYVEIRVWPDLVLLALALSLPLHEPRSTFHHSNRPSSDFQRPVRRGLSDIHCFDTSWFRSLSGMATHATSQERVHWWYVGCRRALSHVVVALPPRGWSQPTVSAKQGHSVGRCGTGRGRRARVQGASRWSRL